MSRVKLDLNSSTFQRSLFALENNEKLRVLNALEKITRLTWQELYAGRGLQWESINSSTGRSGEQLYSFRVSLKTRAVARRIGDFLVLNSIHPDHDSAYH